MSTKILIVEDDAMISEDLAMIVGAEGYTVIGQAYDGITAMDMIQQRQPDIVLLDIALGATSGLDIAKRINERYHLPFIFITSFSDKTTLDVAKNLLPQGYIVKPFKKKDILTTLEIVAHRISVEKQKSSLCGLEEMNKNLEKAITNKEYDIILDIAKGLTNEQIGEIHFISLNTVKSHLKNIFSKLKITSRTQVAGKLFRQ